MSEQGNAQVPGVGSRIARGAMWMVLFKLADRGIGLISTLILARLLTPADFGLVAMATAVVAMIELMSAFGFDTALIQRKDASPAHFNTAWTYNVLFGVACGVLLLCLAIPASEFYREPRLTSILPVLAVASFAQGFENIGTVAFRKEMDFRREFRYLFLKRIITFSITMALAFTLRSYWALVGGIAAGKLLGVVMSYLVHPYRPRFSLSASKDLFGFSKWLLASNLIAFLQNRSSDFVLGRSLGAHALGVYSISFEIATLPSTELVAPLNRAALPGYSQVAHDPARLRSTFLGVIGVVGIFVFPVGGGLAAVAAPAVRLLLGVQWIEAIPLIQIFAVFGTINAFQSNIGQVLLALGLPKVITFMAGGVLVLFLPALYFASVAFGTVGVAWTFLVFSLATMPLVHGIFFKASGMRVGEYLTQVWRPLVGTAVMVLSVAGARHALLMYSPDIPAAVELVVGVATGVVVYVTVLLVLWYAGGRREGPESKLLRAVCLRLPARVRAVL